MMLKRSFDIVLSAAGLVLLSPLLLLIALWIKLDSPGPVLFRQERVGRGGAIFRISKFRTMSHRTAGDGPLITVGNDARVTRAGAFLRRTKLDELPQLADVLRGCMSIVGPRPELPCYVALYSTTLRDKVLSVRPGITDPASIRFRDEAQLLARAADPDREYREVIMPAKLRLSAEYVDRASFASDVRLIFQTLTLVVSRSSR